MLNFSQSLPIRWLPQVVGQNETLGPTLLIHTVSDRQKADVQRIPSAKTASCPLESPLAMWSHWLAATL